MLKPAILAKKGISIDTLRDDPPDKVTLPPEPIYKANVENSTAQSERDRKTRIEQLKKPWFNRCQRIELAGILCGDRPWKFCVNKAVSLTCLSLGMEGLRIFGSQEPTIQIDRISTKDLWKSLDQVFTKQGNITFDRYTFLTRKQLKWEPLKKFYGCLRGHSLNCDLGSHKESIIRDVFIANMQDARFRENYWKKRDRLKRLWKWQRILRWASKISWRCQELLFTRLQNEVTTTSITNIQSSWNRSRALTSNFTNSTICPNCGYGWSATHRQNCPARGKSCKKCGFANHFKKVCRKPKEQI